MNRFNRPSWVTAFLIVCSFGCGVAGAAFIGTTSQKTKKKNEVSRRVWALLKADEEALKASKKERDRKLELEKKEKKHPNRSLDAEKKHATEKDSIV